MGRYIFECKVLVAEQRLSMCPSLCVFCGEVRIPKCSQQLPWSGRAVGGGCWTLVFFASVFQYFLLHVSYVMYKKTAIIFKKQIQVTQKDHNCPLPQFILMPSLTLLTRKFYLPEGRRGLHRLGGCRVIHPLTHRSIMSHRVWPSLCNDSVKYQLFPDTNTEISIDINYW